ncbi:hypothetical protein [Fodinibius roseus]|uniref:hypothetical protein n=1 Tax=Fodinibius roseus TaxID=1194090 RepID=UPI00147B9F4C|nr:hypothetical protein [Fodinibius roseus]
MTLEKAGFTMSSVNNISLARYKNVFCRCSIQKSKKKFYQDGIEPQALPEYSSILN